MKRAMVAVFCVMVLVAAAVVYTAETGKVYYVCNCMDNCKCDYVSSKAGKCTCGTGLVAMHLLAIEKGSGVFCRCGDKCTCERAKDDPKKCGCGKSVKMVGLKGKYVCNCGPDCKCLTISDKPGKCTCGKTLQKVT